MAKKSAAGTIRKKTVTRGGKSYSYWEARATVGYDPGTGKQIQKSVTGKTQREVSQKLTELLKSVNDNSYTPTDKRTVSSWLDAWSVEYLGGVKPRTADSYKSMIERHINPALGALRLVDLRGEDVQRFYNRLQKDGLSPKTIKNIHGTLHKALQQAVKNRYITFNPSDSCELPKAEKAELKPLDDDQIGQFLRAVKGHRHEDLFVVTLFTGMRQGEVCGLMWDCVDLEAGTILVKRQLQSPRKKGDGYYLASTKNGKGRSLTVAPFVVAALRRVKVAQLENRLKYGEVWEDTGFVFTNEIGQHLRPKGVYDEFKRVVEKMGCPGFRFHDLRHSYAVASLRSGDDIKTVQENLGHATAAFTLNTYAHVTEQMKRDSAARMEQFIKAVNK